MACLFGTAGANGGRIKSARAAARFPSSDEVLVADRHRDQRTVLALSSRARR